MSTVQSPARPDRSPALGLHHIGIQTEDLANSVDWYRSFFGCEQQWSLSRFSELTLRRLPGIRTLVELSAAGLRFHLFERPGRTTDPTVSSIGYQHVCISVDRPADLTVLRERWLQLYHSGRYRFPAVEPATDVVADADGVLSFYAYDVNGVEFEFTFVPPPPPAAVPDLQPDA